MNYSHMNPHYTLHKNGNKLTEIYYTEDWLYHRENGPAFIEYDDNKTPKIIKYYKNGLLHREDGPAVITHLSNGTTYSYYYNGKNVNDIYENNPDILTDANLRKILL